MAQNLVATCECGHAGMWHKPDCRIREHGKKCECERFKHSIVRAGSDGMPMQAGRPSRARRQAARGKGPEE